MKTPPPLSPELEALLAPHRTPLPLSPWVESRAIARAAALAADSPEQAGGRVAARPRWFFAAAAGVLLVVGAAAYAARTWTAAPSFRAPAQVAPSAPPRAREAVASAAPAAQTPRTIAPQAPPRRHVASKRSSAMIRPIDTELQLLQTARREVTAGAFADALAVIAEHARRFRNGSLVEEREALRVKSLAGIGRHEDAQRAAAEFHARFPHSVFLSTFERMKEADR